MRTASDPRASGDEDSPPLSRYRPRGYNSRMRHIHGRITLLLASALTCAGVTGCLTVDSSSGDGSLPPDLRSSSDLRRPTVNEPELASTQPSYFASIRQSFDAPVRYLTGDTYSKMAADLESNDANRRRAAVLDYAESIGARDAGIRKAYRVMAQFDNDPLVRAAAVRAINITRDTDPDAGAVILKALKDGHDAVRLEAVKAIANLPQQGVAPQLIATLTDDKQPLDLRIACADALRHYRSPETARALIKQLGQTANFALSWQSRRSLYLMTGKDLRYSEAAWLDYIASADKPVG
jgi:hypothetical protein